MEEDPKRPFIPVPLEWFRAVNEGELTGLELVVLIWLTFLVNYRRLRALTNAEEIRGKLMSFALRSIHEALLNLKKLGYIYYVGGEAGNHRYDVLVHGYTPSKGRRFLVFDKNGKLTADARAVLEKSTTKLRRSLLRKKRTLTRSLAPNARDRVKDRVRVVNEKPEIPGGSSGGLAEGQESSESNIQSGKSGLEIRSSRRVGVKVEGRVSPESTTFHIPHSTGDPPEAPLPGGAPSSPPASSGKGEPTAEEVEALELIGHLQAKLDEHYHGFPSQPSTRRDLRAVVQLVAEHGAEKVREYIEFTAAHDRLSTFIQRGVDVARHFGKIHAEKEQDSNGNGLRHSGDGGTATIPQPDESEYVSGDASSDPI